MSYTLFTFKLGAMTSQSCVLVECGFALVDDLRISAAPQHLPFSAEWLVHLPRGGRRLRHCASRGFGSDVPSLVSLIGAGKKTSLRKTTDMQRLNLEPAT